MIPFIASIAIGLVSIFAGLWLLSPGLCLIVIGLFMLSLFGLRTTALYLWHGPVAPGDDEAVIHEDS